MVRAITMTAYGLDSDARIRPFMVSSSSSVKKKRPLPLGASCSPYPSSKRKGPMVAKIGNGESESATEQNLLFDNLNPASVHEGRVGVADNKVSGFQAINDFCLDAVIPVNLDSHFVGDVLADDKDKGRSFGALATNAIGRQGQGFFRSPLQMDGDFTVHAVAEVAVFVFQVHF